MGRGLCSWEKTKGGDGGSWKGGQRGAKRGEEERSGAKRGEGRGKKDEGVEGGMESATIYKLV